MKEKFKILLEKLCCDVLKARWIVSTSEDSGELGFRIAGVNFWYYKHSDPMIVPDRSYRIADKREFGEVIRSIKEKE